MIELISCNNIEDAGPILSQILDILRQAEYLIGYPYESFTSSILELEDVFHSLPQYVELQDYLSERLSERYGEVEKSNVLLRRGARRLESNEPYEAIKLIGQALTGLYKHESRYDIVYALLIISSAYEKVDLIWAARGSALTAASIATNEFHKYETLNTPQVRSYLKMMFLEAQLGRVSHSLLWSELALITASAIDYPLIEQTDFQAYEALLGKIFLNADLKDLKRCEYLPGILERLTLSAAESFLTYCLGHEEKFCRETESVIDDEQIKYFSLLKNYNFDCRIREIKTFSDKWDEIDSIILGCQIKVSFPIRTPFIELAESILAVLESFSATSVTNNVFARESSIQIDIIADDEDEISISHELDSSSAALVYTINCSCFTSDMLNISGQSVINDWLKSFVLEIYARMTLPKDFEEHFETLIIGEKAFERSLSFNQCFSSQFNVLGSDFLKSIISMYEKGDKHMELLRKIPWYIEHNVVDMLPDSFCDEIDSSSEENPEELLDNDYLKHSDFRTQSLIKYRLWDEAEWQGVGYVVAPNEFPALILLFKNENAAEAIFRNFLQKVGKTDSQNLLRISLIRKINQKEPLNYHIALSENPKKGDTKRYAIESRIHTMTPSTNEHLEVFLQQYKKFGRYLFLYALVKGGEMYKGKNSEKLSIQKQEIVVKDAWSVGLNELESTLISQEDDPIVPEGITKPPYEEVLRQRESRK